MPSPRLLAASLISLLCLTGCGSSPSDQRSAPAADACRNLTPADIGSPTNDSPAVDCRKPHTAQTFFVGTFPASVTQRAQAGAYVYSVCNQGFADYVGADESLALRIQLSWAWFGPSDDGWAKGARWFRCDIVGGPVGATDFVSLPLTVKALFQSGTSDFRAAPPEQWLTCGSGADFATRHLVACSKPHDWRAITTVKLGQPQDPYPGDHASEAQAHNLCADAVSAWLNYSSDYDYGYTWFHEAEWKVGNRRAICWARTPN